MFDTVTLGAGGEWHQLAMPKGQLLTTAQGMPVSDDQNSLKAGPRGLVLLEDFALREKIFHFDHERIPERVVHARGTAAHGVFRLYESLAEVTRAKVLSETAVDVPVFVRFSTVAGNRGSADLARDVRGFAVKFYTGEGNWDLVGNNIPVFFVQDAIKFPDLVHAVKEEPDRGFPQAASAHDTFWDFIALTPEAMHMVMWQMSDRTIPRSLRMMEGFGVHSFRLVNDAGQSTFVKLHWKPALGCQSVVWDEAVKINGADPDFHRRDLYEAIEKGDFPEWELAVQLFSEAEAEAFPFDHLDPTKFIPEELVPLRRIGTLTLNRNPSNVFDETEQVAFCTSNLVPGIDFSDDPLLHGRNFSYLDTQLKRLGSTNFTKLPINAPRCPFATFQREGHMQTEVHKGRVSYSPSMLDPSGPRADPAAGFRTFPASVSGATVRERSASFSDHYSQARQFYLSQATTEQDHIVAALVFELGKVETLAVRAAMLGHLMVIEASLGRRVAAGLGFDDDVPAPPVAVEPVDLPHTAAVSMMANPPMTLKGRCVGVLLSEGADATLLAALQESVAAAEATLKIVAPKIGGVTLDDGSKVAADHALAGGPSVLFDSVGLLVSAEAAAMMAAQAAAVAWVHDAFQHLKIIGASAGAQPLLDKAGVMADAGVVMIESAGDVDEWLEVARELRIWSREPMVRRVD
ncbi:catalase [Sandaracinobacteroides saxicola]|uniref:Catalase n=1 Tax=Sandaracinobacteroides saxicola TaxID=2759707 RepID=A0A7G5IMH1_9SPHN|nr:catalase [Sandaracinobacteroides saxicola]